MSFEEEQRQLYQKIINQISEYQGVFNAEAQHLAQSMRNLYSLSRRHDIVQIISKLQTRAKSDKPKFTEKEYQLFESTI